MKIRLDAPLWYFFGFFRPTLVSGQTKTLDVLIASTNGLPL